MDIVSKPEPELIRSVDSAAIRSILDKVPVRELEAIRLDEIPEDEASS